VDFTFGIFLHARVEHLENPAQRIPIPGMIYQNGVSLRPGGTIHFLGDHFANSLFGFLDAQSVLLILLSLITWVPGLVLFGVQASLAGTEWLGANLWIAWALFAGAWIWILIVALLALALSAWIKWRMMAGALLLAVFFVAAAFGETINAALDVQWGKLINLMYLLMVVWRQLFRLRDTTEISPASAWLVLALICAGCLALLYRKVRAVEVVK